MNAGTAAINAMSAWVTLFVFLPTIAHGQPATGPAAPCANRFPYGPQQFLKKLLAVADEADPDAVPAKFQNAFGMKFRPAITKCPQTQFYTVTKCDWYAHVIIVTVADPKLSEEARAFVVLGDPPLPLSFGDLVRGECLSSTFAEKSLTASGWEGGVTLGEFVTWVYRRGHTKLDFDATRVTPDRDCISTIKIFYQ
jgi:hypothetical protein